MTTTRPLSGAPIPHIRQDLLKVVRVRAMRQVDAVILSTKIYGVYTHWHEGRTRHCPGNESGCQLCVRQCPKKWRGYLHASFGLQGPAGLLELTPLLARDLLDAWPSLESLRGIRVTLRRGKSNNSRIVLESTNDLRTRGADLPPEIDPWPTLEFLFSC